MTSGIVFVILRISLSLVLYAFLGWALWFLWRDLKDRSKQTWVSTFPPIVLLPVEGLAPEPLEFSQAEISIGRDPACRLVLDDQSVSAQHARLNFRMGQWWIEDLGSRNGTFLNQELLRSPVVVTDGDRIRIGGVSFVVSLAVATPIPMDDTDFPRDGSTSGIQTDLE